MLTRGPLRSRLFGAALLAGVLVTGCDGGSTAPTAAPAPSTGATAAGPTTTLGSSGAAIENLITTVIRPRLQVLASSAAALQATLGPDRCGTDVPGAQAAWRKTRSAWDALRPFAFGPQKNDFLASVTDAWPTTPDKVEAFAAGDAPVTTTSVGELGSGQVGLPAIERLVFSGSMTPRRCAYAAEAARGIAVGARRVDEDWAREARPFAAGDRAVDEVVSILAETAYSLSDDHLAQPAGLTVTKPGPPKPGLVRGGPGGAATADIREVVAAIHGAYLTAIAPVLRERKLDEVTATVDAAFAAAAAAAAALPDDLAATIAADPQRVAPAIAALQTARRTLSTQVAGALGLTLSFSSADGD